MIRGTKVEFECIANKRTPLVRDIEYFLEVNHPRKLAKNNFKAEVISHKVVDEWGTTKVKEIILYRKGEYCLVNYFQGKDILADACIYVAEPVEVGFIKEEV